MADVVLITGGDRGIGYATAKKFAEKGFCVAICYEKNENAAFCAEKELGITAIKCDVSNFEDVDKMFSEIEKKLGEVMILVNNAGVSVIGLFQDLSSEEWDRLFGVNVKGVFNCTKRALSNMIGKKSGSIINVSSMWGRVGASCETHYSATKAAVIGYTESLAKELGPSGIRVNCVAPGTIDTEMNGHLSQRDIDDLKNDTPLEKIGKPEEVADAIYYLASDEASFVTGAVLNINGGYIVG